MTKNKLHGHGYYRKSKAYGLVCGIALATTFLMWTNAVSADQHSSSQSVIEVVSPSQEFTQPVTSSNLEAAKQQATEAGVTVTTDTGPLVYNSFEKAEADLEAQVTAVKEAITKQEANTERIEEAIQANAEIARRNTSEIERVATVNEQGQKAVDEANAQGQAAVDERNRQGQANTDQRNQEAKAAYEAQKAAIKKRNDDGQAAVYERNRQGQEAVDTYNRDEQARVDVINAELEESYKTELRVIADVEAHNAGVRERNAQKQADADAEKARLQADYERRLAQFEALKQSALSSKDKISLNGDLDLNASGLAVFRNLKATIVSDQKLETLTDGLYWGADTTVEVIKGFRPYTLADGKQLDISSEYTYTGWSVGDQLLIKNVGHLSTSEPVNLLLTVKDTGATSHHIPNLLAVLKDPFSDGIKFVVFNHSKTLFDLTLVTADGRPRKTALSQVVGDVDYGQHSRLSYNGASLLYNPEGSGLIPNDSGGLKNSPDHGVNEYDQAPKGTYVVAGYGDTISYYHSADDGNLAQTQEERDRGAIEARDGSRPHYVGYAFSLFGRSVTIHTDEVFPPEPKQVELEKETPIPPAPAEPNYVTPNFKTFTPEVFTPEPDNLVPPTPEVFTPETFTPSTYTPITPELLPPLLIPNKETYTAAVHPAVVKVTVNPEKDVIDDKGRSINGQSVLPDSTLNYVAKQDFDQYKGIALDSSAILKNVLYLDDYLDEALDGQSMMVHSITADNGDDVSRLLEMRHVLSQDALDDHLKALIKDSGISPVGQFYIWVAKDPQAFYEAYVKKGLNITYNLSFKMKQDFVGTVTNQTYQIDFGRGYHGNIVTNDVPPLIVHKQVLNKDGQFIDGQTVKLGDKVTYKLEGWIIPAGRGYDINEYRFVDILQSSHDKFDSYAIKASVDITLPDGQLIKAGDDLMPYSEYSYNAETGLFELRLKEEFIASIQRTSAFGATAYVTVERLTAGEVVNEYTLYVNGRPVVSNKVTTHTEEPPAPPVPLQPRLPETGETTGILSVLSGLLTSLLGLLGLSQKKKQKK